MQDGFSDIDLNALMVRIAAGDHGAFRVLYEDQSPRLYGLALRMLRQPERAADAVHDAFVEIWQRASRFDPERGRVAPWLGTILRYRVIDIQRRTGREGVSGDHLEGVDPDPDPLSRLENSEANRALHQCLDALDPHQKAAVLSAFFKGWTHSELSEAFGAPLGTVKAWVRRGLLALRKCLGP